MRNKKRSEGFSLVELLVALVILMVVGTIAVQQFSGETDKAKVKTTKGSLNVLQSALERFKLDMGRYPTEDEGLRALIEQPEDDEDGNWGPKYIQKDRHLRDAWNNEYGYFNPGPDGEPYEIISYGADGGEGGEGKFDQDISTLDE